MIISFMKRYWAKVGRAGPEDCWLWNGSRTVNGYGQIFNGAKKRGAPQKSLATHCALAIDGRERPSELHVAMHPCDQPRCVNPKHLRWGTVQENMADMKAKGRSARQMTATDDMDIAASNLSLRPRAAKLSPSDVRLIRSSALTTIALAEQLGVTNQCISNVRTGKTWKGVNREKLERSTLEMLEDEH